MPLLYVAPGTQVDLQRAAPNTVISQGPADQIEPLTPLGCLTQWRPPTFRPTLMPEPQTATPRPGDSFTDVSVALGVAFDAHQLDRVIFYNAPLLSQVQLELATAIDREECRNPKSSQHPYLAEWQLAAAHVDSAARGQELHYEEHQGAVVRLGLLQQCDMWTRRREHWIDKDAQRGTWGAAGYSVELRSDFASWSRPVSSRHVLTRQPRQRRTTAPLQSQPVESPFPLTPSDSSISGPSSETLPLVAADSIHRRLRPIALLELKRLLACPEVVMIVLHKLATGTSRIILNRGLESGSSSVNGFALERRPDLPLGFDLNVDQNVIVQIVQQHWRGVEHGEADFVVGSAPDGQYCRRVREKVVKACMQASLPSSHPSSVSSVSKPNPAPPPRTPCPWSALRVGLAYVCVVSHEGTSQDVTEEDHFTLSCLS